MSESTTNEPPGWHLDYLKDREIAVANGEDFPVGLEEFEADLRKDYEKVYPVPPALRSKVAIALQTLSDRPIHGLRHPVDGDTNGWYIWCGKFSEDDDFFQPLCIEHLNEHLPQILTYLSLPPGSRFLVDDCGNEDVWFDESLLEI